MEEAPISLLSQEDNNLETSQNENSNEANASAREQVDMMEIQSIVLREFTEKANSILEQLHAAKQSYETYKPSGDMKTSGAAVEEPVAKKVKIDHRITTNDRQCTSADRDSDTISLNPSDNEFSEDEGADLEDYDQEEQEEEEVNEDPDFQDLLNSIEENLGPNIDQKLASVMQNIWGKSTITDKMKKHFKKIKIPITQNSLLHLY